METLSDKPPEAAAGRRPTVAISIVTWNSALEIGECLRPLEELPENWEVWVVDNNSSDATTTLVREDFGFVRLIANPDNKGFAAANNQVVAGTRSDYVLFLNPDTEAAPETLERALEIAESDPRIGILGVRLVNEDGSLQPTCYHFPTPLKNFVDAFGLHRLLSPARRTELFASDFFAHDAPRNADWIKGAFMLARRSAMERAGAIPEDYFMFGEDLDFCWQIAQKGFDVRFSPDVSVIHKANKSAGQLPSRWRVERTTLSKHLFVLKNFGFLRGRFVQLTDLLAVNYNLLRGRLRDPHAPALAEWRMYRREIRRGLLMSRRRIEQILHER